MIKDKEQLLLLELCSRFPNCVKVKVGENTGILRDVNPYSKIIKFGAYRLESHISNAKLCLRDVSDMTDEECDKLFKILKIDEDTGDWIKINDDLGIKFFLQEGRWSEDLIEAYDYLNSIHVDYRRSIHLGVAIEVKRDFYFK